MSGSADPSRRPWLIATGDFVTTGGMDAANHALASYLARTGHRVDLVAHRVAGELAALPGVRVHRVPRPLGSNLLGEPLIAAAARRLSTGVVALANGGNFPAPATWLHYVHAAHAPASPGAGLRRALRAAARGKALRDERRVAAAARVVIANSALTARHAVERLGAREDRVHVVYYGADRERFGPPAAEERAAARRALEVEEDTPVIAFVGALGDRRKGFDTVMAALRRLAAEPGWDAVLLAAGAGSELSRWRREVAELGLARRIRLLGFQPDVRPLLAAADAVVAPSRYEAYGLAVQEALCTGVPALVSRRAGVAERVEGPLEALLLDDPEDAGELAERLRTWRADAPRMAEAARALSARLREWSWDHMAARLVDIVESAL